MKIILVEYIDEFGNWNWYGVYYNGTLEEALKSYAEDNDIEGELEFKKDGRYLYFDKGIGYARAEKVYLIDLN